MPGKRLLERGVAADVAELVHVRAEVRYEVALPEPGGVTDARTAISVGHAHPVFARVIGGPIKLAAEQEMGYSESEIEPDCILKPSHFAWAQQAATPVQPRLVDRVEVGRVDVAHLMPGQADVAVYGYMGARRPFSAGDHSDSNGAQPLAQGADGQHDYWVVAYPGQMSVPDFSSERIHG